MHFIRSGGQSNLIDFQGRTIGQILLLCSSRGDANESGFVICEQGIALFMFPPNYWKGPSDERAHPNRFKTMEEAEQALILGLKKYTQTLFVKE